MGMLGNLRAKWRRARSIPGNMQQLIEDSARMSIELARLEVELAHRIEESHRRTLRELPIRAALLSHGLASSAHNHPKPEAPRSSMDLSEHVSTIDEQWIELAQIAPEVFPIWRELFEHNTDAYAEETLASCSHADSEYSQLFKAFVELNACGPTLDIGVGSRFDPYYLDGLAAENLVGIDPLKFTGDATRIRRFEGFCELLPFQDETFTTVISGTSLDHVLDLPRSLQEMRRILTRNGRALLWVASVPGSPSPLDSTVPFTPADRFHLFHFDRSWLDPLLAESFRLVDVVEIPQVGFDHVFYHLSRRDLV